MAVLCPNLPMIIMTKELQSNYLEPKMKKNQF